MNKSWKKFDQLVSTPCYTKSARKSSYPRNGRVSRALTQLFPKSPNRSLNRSILNRPLPEDDFVIEDASDEENTPPQPEPTQQEQDCSIEPCSAPSLEPKDLLAEPTRPESDIEEVSDDDDKAAPSAEVISETSSSDSDCESIRCKRAKRVATLDYVKSPGRQITDDTLLVVSAVPRAATLEKSTTWMKAAALGGGSSSSIKTTPVAKKRSSWIKLDESFKVNSPRTTEKRSSRWKELEKSFQPSPEAEIESLESTPDNLVVAAAGGGTDVVPETVGCFYEPSRDGPMRKRKGCPLSRLQAVLFEKASRQTFWLHERQMGLAVGKRPVKVESIKRIFGRVAISYKEQDRDEPSLQVEHVVYVDPGEKQLKMLGKGSLIEIEHDLEPHKLRRNRVVHLGVCKIRVVN